MTSSRNERQPNGSERRENEVARQRSSEGSRAPDWGVTRVPGWRGPRRIRVVQTDGEGPGGPEKRSSAPRKQTPLGTRGHRDNSVQHPLGCLDGFGGFLKDGGNSTFVLASEDQCRLRGMSELGQEFTGQFLPDRGSWLPAPLRGTQSGQPRPLPLGGRVLHGAACARVVCPLRFGVRAPGVAAHTRPRLCDELFQYQV